MSLFVDNDDDNETYIDNGINETVLEHSQADQQSRRDNDDATRNEDDAGANRKEDDEQGVSIPVVFEERPDIIPVYESKEVSCLLPLSFHQEILEDMLSKDGLLILGRGLGWEIVAANLLYALSSPSVSLVTGDRERSKKSLVIVLNARDEENIKLSDELTDLHWVNKTSVNGLDPEEIEQQSKKSEPDDLSDSDRSPLTIISGDITTADKRRRIYDSGGIVSVKARVLVVDILSGVISPHDITGLFILHAERLKETSNESFIVNLYRDSNEWGFVKAVSDEPESFTGFTPLATNLKVLRLSNIFLWPRFHVEVSASLTYKGKFSKSQKSEVERSRYVTEINVQLSYKMRKIQSALLSCIQSCLQELKRHNPSLVTEYWDMENIHDIDFVPRIRLSLDSQWHRISWTSKQLVFDLSTLKDLLKNLLVVDALSFYQVVQGIVDSNVKSSAAGSMFTSSMSPWLNLDEADTVISYAKDRALGKIKVSRRKQNSESIDVDADGDINEDDDESNYDTTEEYVLEELPKWDQLGLLLDDIMYEKTQAINARTDGPVLIMCSNPKTARQLSKLIPTIKKEENTMTGKRRFSSRKYMISKLNDYLEWKELSRLTKKINVELDQKPEVNVSEADPKASAEAEELQTSKTFTRGKGHPLSKRRRTRGAAAVANVQKLYSGSISSKNTEAVDLESQILEKLQEDAIVDDEEDKQEDDYEEYENDAIVEEQDFLDEAGEQLFVTEDEQAGSLPSEGGFLPNDTENESVVHIMHDNSVIPKFRPRPRLSFEHIDTYDQIIVESYSERNNDALLQEISPAYIIMYEPSLSFIRRVEMYQAINKESPARTYFMYYGTSVEEQSHLLKIKKEKEAFTRLIREKASLSKNFATEVDDWKFQIRKKQVVNTRIAGGSSFRTNEEDMQVVVDVREFNSSLPNLLYRVGIKVVPCMITVGDYIVSPKICIERKAIPDLISSFKSGRLYKQCEQMFRHYEIPTLLIEFDANQSFSFEPFSDLRNKLTPTNPIATKLMGQDIQSKIIMLLIAFPKLKIIWSSSPYETAQIFLELKANQEEPDIGEAISKGVDQQITSSDGSPPMYNDDAIDLIQNIPGINNVNFYTVIQKVKSIEQLVQLSREELHELIGQENGNKAFNFINHTVR